MPLCVPATYAVDTWMKHCSCGNSSAILTTWRVPSILMFLSSFRDFCTPVSAAQCITWVMSMCFISRGFVMSPIIVSTRLPIALTSMSLPHHRARSRFSASSFVFALTSTYILLLVVDNSCATTSVPTSPVAPVTKTVPSAILQSIGSSPLSYFYK